MQKLCTKAISYHNIKKLHQVSVLTLKYPLRFDNKFVPTRQTTDKFVAQTHPNILKHN